MKWIKKTIVVILIVFITVVSYTQYVVEKHIDADSDRFSIKNKKRTNYLPFVFYRLNSNEEKYCRGAARKILKENQNKLKNGFHYHGHIDSYIVFCYYSKQERDSIINNNSLPK